MIKRIKRSVVLLATVALLATAFAPASLMSKAAANSYNTISKVVNVDSTTDLSDTENQFTPVIKIAQDNYEWIGTQSFKLTLDNGAQWTYDENAEESDGEYSYEANGFVEPYVVQQDDAVTLNLAQEDLYIGTNNGDTVNEEPAADRVEVTRMSDSVLLVECIQDDEGLPWADDAYILVPLAVKTGGGLGENKVTVSNMDSSISGGTYTYAVSADGGTVASVGTAKNISRQSRVELGTITFDESRIGAVNEPVSSFTLRLPYGFEWDDSDAQDPCKLVPGGGWVDGVEFDMYDEDGNYNISNDERDLTITAYCDTPSVTRRGTVSITPIVKVTSEAKQGDVLMQVLKVKGDWSSASDLKVAVYGDYGVTVTPKTVETLIAGNLQAETLTAEITVKENSPGSFIANRPIDLELPDFVNFINNEDNDDSDPLTFTNGDVFTQSNPNTVGRKLIQLDWAYDDAVLDLPRDNNLRYFKFKAHLVVSGDFCDITKADAKDITLKLSHAGVAAQEAVIAKAVPPFVVTQAVTDVKLGLQNQVSSDITIKEVVAGAIDRWGAEKILRLETPAIPGFYITNLDSVTVTEGDLSLNAGATGTTSAKTAIDIYIKGASSKPSTIVLKGIKLTTDRNVPEMLFPFRFGAGFDGSAVNDAACYNYPTFGSRCGSVDYVNMITPAERDIMAQSQFTIGSTTYKMLVDGVWVDKTMDAAPFIQDGRTMVPLRFVGEALGATVKWEDATSSAILMQSSLVVRVQPNSDTMLVNGTPIKMDTKAVMKAGRMYLPVSQVGLAMNAKSAWDAATQTATFTVFPR